MFYTSVGTKRKEMNILEIKKHAKREASPTHVVECQVYLKHNLLWYCPDPSNKFEVERLEREFEEGKWVGKESRWITEEQYLLWNLSVH